MIVELQIKEMHSVGGGLCICNYKTSPIQYRTIINVGPCMERCCTTVGNTWDVFTVNGNKMTPVGSGVCNKTKTTPKKKKGGGTGGGNTNIIGNGNMIINGHPCS